MQTRTKKKTMWMVNIGQIKSRICLGKVQWNPKGGGKYCTMKLDPWWSELHAQISTKKFSAKYFAEQVDLGCVTWAAVSTPGIIHFHRVVMFSQVWHGFVLKVIVHLDWVGVRVHIGKWKMAVVERRYVAVLLIIKHRTLTSCVSPIEQQVPRDE